jgi:hypothetical protein
MHSARRTLITLSAALLLGVAFGLAGLWGKQVTRDEDPVPAGETITADDAKVATASAASFASSAHTVAASSSTAHAAAWELLKDGKLQRRERQQLESMLLREWSKVDLRAALHAAFEGHWRDLDNPFEFLPMDTCLEEETQADLLWELLLSREYGLHTRRLRREWIHITARKDPLEILRRLPEMPPDMRAGAVGTAVASSHHFADFPRDRPAAGKEEVIAAVLALRGSPYEAAVMTGLAGGISSITEISELSGLLLSPPDPALRDLYLKAYAMEVEHGSSDGRQVALDMLPAEVRAEVEALLGSRSIRIHGLVFPLTEPVPLPPGE